MLSPTQHLSTSSYFSSRRLSNWGSSKHGDVPTARVPCVVKVSWPSSVLSAPMMKSTSPSNPLNSFALTCKNNRASTHGKWWVLNEIFPSLFLSSVSITNESQFLFARILNSIFFFDTDETQAGVVLKKTYDSGIHASQDDTWWLEDFGEFLRPRTYMYLENDFFFRLN